MSIELSSNAFPAGQTIPPKYSGDGENCSPPLNWAGLPKGTRELALIVDDPDAPRAEPFVHWVIYKIPADASGLVETRASHAETAKSLHNALQGQNSRGEFGYTGPMPPPGHGTHHYHFHLYALDQPLNVDAGLDKRALLSAMAGHILEETDMVGTYER
jgi:Raf kinase inhibitor-like YbhB/YbcL family protein